LRLVIDTNILVSALLSENSLPAHLITLWRQSYFELLTAPEQLAELGRVTRYPRIRERVSASLAGRFINELRDIAVVVARLPTLDVSSDPNDNYLLALAGAGAAAFLVTGDKRDLLALGRYEQTRIITVRDFLTLTKRLP